ncbi:nuclear transport factor 2 family protein [Pseudomonas lopnurensis]|uniref:nuclear transport factor 2 family protein n=1 Tax=Pseudomonas lopnurensis TaxID=1477517 RepID=UPI0028B196D2|nr:nuclear transport factor 2 family protein [Pseudomonas lopnurensis]
MDKQLPPPIAAFYSLSNGQEGLLLGQCFSADAVVVDERRSHVGLDEISAWLSEAQRLYRFRAEPLEFLDQGAQAIIPTKVTGTFPGSPIELRYVFHINGERIERLEIR